MPVGMLSEFIVDCNHGISHGMWSEDEMGKSSTWRELVAVKRVLVSLNHEIKEKRVKWFTDNKNIVGIVSKGSMRADLQRVALDIFRHCLINGIQLEMEWIPRSMNDKADFISRLQRGNSSSFFEPIKKQKLKTMEACSKKVTLSSSQGKVKIHSYQ